MGRMHNDRVPARLCVLEAWQHTGVGTPPSLLDAASMLTGEYDTPAVAWRSAQKHLHSWETALASPHGVPKQPNQQPQGRGCTVV